jgi:hypothetical protein
MEEPALEFDGVALSPQKETVRVFYKELWDHGDKSLIPIIFHSDFTFRGSLGPTLVGHEKFAEYVDWVTGALEHYKTDILALIEEGNRVSGKTRFHGVHRKELFGCRRLEDTFGGSACPSSLSRRARSATCSCSAIFTALSVS